MSAQNPEVPLAPSQSIEASPDRGPELQDEANTDTAVALAAEGTGKGRGQGQDGDKDTPSAPEPLEGGERRDDPEQSDVRPPLPVGEDPPPLPEGEEPPPLPDEAPPNDGWEPVWDDSNQTYYFYNRLTGVTQWENPRVPEATTTATTEGAITGSEPPEAPLVHGGYNPAIHGDYDPNADYAIEARQREQAAAEGSLAQALDPSQQAPGTEYAATGAFNRFTGRWQAADQNPERHGDEAKSKRQMNAFFDVDAAANSHGGRSLKAERQSKKLSKSELKAFKEKRKERKEEKRRAWLRD